MKNRDPLLLGTICACVVILAGCTTYNITNQPSGDPEPEAVTEWPGPVDADPPSGNPVPGPAADEPGPVENEPVEPEPQGGAPSLEAGDGPLVIASIQPEQGPTDGGTIVAIRGEGFTESISIRFGDRPAKGVFLFTDGLITAVVPPSETGNVDVILEDVIDSELRVVGLSRAYTYFPLAAGDTGSDKDGDGRTDAQEVAGYDIEVDIFGFGLTPDHIVLLQTVTSDPNLADTDSDGLNDLDEFLNRTNPSDVDTDDDGLWDDEEVNRWLTSPVSIDTDGDARSADPSTDFSTLPPNSALFDGNELYASADLALDPASRGPVKFHATSPSLDDTDGDNVSDFDEYDTPVRTTLLADMPQLLFEIVDDVDIRLDVEYAEEEGRTTSLESSFSTSQSLAKSTSQTVSASVTVGASVEVGTSTKATASVEVTAGYEHSWGTEATTGSEQAFTEAEENSRTLTETAATGSMKAGIKVSNIGNISVQVVDLGWTVRQWEPNFKADPLDTSPGSYNTFASLGVELPEGLTLAPGADSGVQTAEATDINADRVKAFLAKPDSMQIEPAAFELVNEAGINFAFIEEITQARTGRVTIDFGDGTFEEYRVATNVDRNTDSSLAGIKMSKVMDLTVGPGNWETQSINPPCGPLTDVVTNGSFESPDLNGGSPAEPTGWNVRTPPARRGGVGPGTVLVVEEQTHGAPDAVEGDQLVLITPAVFDKTALNQQIGVVADNLDYDFSAFVQSTGGTTWTISLWAGDPGAGGTQLDSASLDNGGPTTVSGTLNTGVGNSGADLYVEIMIDEQGARGGGNDSLFIDAFEVLADVPIEALYRVRDVDTDFSTTPRFWAVFLSEGLSPNATRFEDVVLRHGESVLLALTQDADSDGLYAAQEQQYGSSDATSDTDGDLVPDAIESARQYINQTTCEILDGGWVVKITPANGPPEEIRVYSNPTVVDSDGDGLTDNDERLGTDGIAAGDPGDTEDATNPLSRDTDQDGLTDDVDPKPLIEAGKLFVDIDATTGGLDGSSWDNAFIDLGLAMNDAATRNGDGSDTNDISEIWVAEGTYTLANQGLPDAVNIYGGFSGVETRLGQRVANGVINGTVVNPFPTVPAIFQLTTVTARLDGLAFQNSALSPAVRLEIGNNSTITIANCFFFNNIHVTQGLDEGAAAIYSRYTHLTLEDCVFADNFVAATTPAGILTRGGAVRASGTGHRLIVRRCSFSRNSIELIGGPLSRQALGGALAVGNMVATIEDCQFTNNRILEGADLISMNGGAVSFDETTATVQNCVFEENELDYRDFYLGRPVVWSTQRAGGGVAMIGGASVNFINSLFLNNRAGSFGGGLYVEDGSDARVANCTFYGNSVYVDLPSDLLFTLDAQCSGQIGVTPIAVGGGIGATGDVNADNCVFWANNNEGADFFIDATKTQSDIGSLDVLFLDVEQQISTAPLLAPLDDPDVLSCLSASGSIRFSNCAIENPQIVLGFIFGEPDPAIPPVFGPGVFDVPGIVEGLNNVSPEDPGFVSPSTGNLRLLGTSLLIDAGNSLIDVDRNLAGFQLLPDFDLDDKERIVDGDGDENEEIDIGAYEYQGSN